MSIDLLSNLNPPQQEAVITTEGPLLIFAGAGSGKTRVLVHRVAYLLQAKKIHPTQLLAVTFTNKAAEQMRHRVAELTGFPAGSLWISTFHAAGVKILRRHINRLGINQDFVIYDDSDRMSLIKKCLAELNINPKLFNPRQILGAISTAKNNLIAPEYFPKEDFFNEKAAKVYHAYEQQLKKSHAVDLDDLLVLPVRLFREFPEILAYYHNQLKYFLVDEYQDTNHAQYQLMKLLAKNSQNLCVVGDDDQSIYSWRGADIRNILDFEKDFSDAKVVKLEQNYRCSGRILQAAYEVVKKIRQRAPKTLWTDNAPGEPITYFTGVRDLEEARFVVQEIQKLKGEWQLSNRDFAIFYRTNAQSRPFEDELRRQNIPYVIYGGMKFYERMEIKDILAYLLVLLNPNDSVNLKRIINVPARGIGKTTVEKLENFAAGQGLTLWDALLQVEATGLSTAPSRTIRGFVNLLEELRKNINQLRPSQLVNELLKKTGYIDVLQQEGTLEAENRIENIEELVNVLAEFEIEQPESGLRDFLDQVSLNTELQTTGEDTSALPLMTLHLAKGLEFPVVFVVGLEEGLCPHIRSMSEPSQMDEERRLFYVGMTRAERKLYLTNAVERRFFGQEQFNLPSRFLEDIPIPCIETVRPPDVKLNKPAISLKTHSVELECEIQREDPYRRGVRVAHPIFGIGTIEACEGGSAKRKLTVKFQKVGTKKLLAEFSNLVIL